jgi:hypothetical protein
VQAQLDLLDAEVPPEPHRAHALDCGGDGRVIVPCQSEPAEAYQFDRALHAMVAALTGGISPVALSLAYIDWAAHLAAAPQRQLTIAQDALRSTNEFFRLTRHGVSSAQPWALIKPQAQDRRFAEQPVTRAVAC